MDINQFSEHEWNHFHDVILHVHKMSEERDILKAIFQSLPEEYQLEDSIHGMNDTGWRESVIEYYESEQKKINQIMEDYNKSMVDYAKECNEENTKILKQIESEYGEQLVNDLIDIIYDLDSGTTGKFRIESKPKGQLTESFKSIKEWYVDQIQRGLDGDSYSGTVSYKIGDNKWLETDFEL